MTAAQITDWNRTYALIDSPTGLLHRERALTPQSGQTIIDEGAQLATIVACGHESVPLITGYLLQPPVEDLTSVAEVGSDARWITQTAALRDQLWQMRGVPVGGMELIDQVISLTGQPLEQLTAAYTSLQTLKAAELPCVLSGSTALLAGLLVYMEGSDANPPWLVADSGTSATDELIWQRLGLTPLLQLGFPEPALAGQICEYLLRSIAENLDFVDRVGIDGA